MSANSSSAGAAVSDVLDLNADAAAVENQEPSLAEVAEKALKEPLVGSGAPLNENLDGEGTGARDDGEWDVNFLVAQSKAEAASKDVPDPGGDVVTDQGVVMDISKRSDCTEEAKRNQSPENEAVGDGSSSDGYVKAVEGCPSHGDDDLNRGEFVVEFERGIEGKEEAPSSVTAQGMEPDVVDRSTGPDDGCVQEGDRGGDQEAYHMKLGLPEGGEVVPAVEEQSMNSEPVDGKPTDEVDVIAPEFNIVMGVTVEANPAVEVQNMNPQLGDEKPVDMGDVIMADLISVSGMSVIEGESDDTHRVDETSAGRGDVVMVDSALVAEAVIPVTSQPSESQNVGSEALLSDVERSSSQVEVSAGLLLGETQKIEAQHGDPHLVDENPVAEGDVVMGDSDLVEEIGLPKDQSGGYQTPSSEGEHDASQVKLSAGSLLDENQKVEAQREVIHMVGENPTDNKDVVVADSNSTAEAILPETSQPSETQNVGSQAQPSEIEYGSSQVKASSGGLSLVENQNIEAQLVGSLPDGNQDSQLLLCLDRSPNGGNGLATESEAVQTDVCPPEGPHGQEVKVDKREVDEVISVPDDNIENYITEKDTDGDQKADVKAAELLKKAEKQTLKRTIIKPGTAVTENDQRACYYLPQEEKSVFSTSDLVWGKVKSHPWWPGQIFDPSDASEMALKHHKKDNFLVAYFGDKTFAWCEESQLKPFQTCFSHMEKQSASDVFVNAVNSALGEVSRHVELGMRCFCLPEQSFNNLKYQNIENAGIREGASCSVLDKSLGVVSFQPDRFLEYIHALAQFPCGGADRLELTIAKGHLLAFNRSKGYTDLPEFYVGGGLLENDAVISPSERKRHLKALIEDPTPVSMDEEKMPTDLISGKGKPKAGGSVLHRHKHILEDDRKQKTLSEVIVDKKDSDPVSGGGSGSEAKVYGKSLPQSSGKKHKGIDSLSGDSGKSNKKRFDALGDLETKSLSPTLNRSFKVGECIRRVARKLTGSPPIVKCNGESFNRSAGEADLDSHLGFDDSLHTPEDSQRMKTRESKDYSSPDEMLSRLCLYARDPMKGYSFLSTIISFFTDIRKLRDSSSAIDKNPLESKRGRKKSSYFKTDFSEISTPDYMKDSYWTDRVVYSSSGGKQLSSGRKRKGESKMLSPTRKAKSTKEPSDSLPLSKMLETAHHLRISAVSPTANRDLAVEKQVNFFGEKCVESNPTALILSFTESDVLPSETDIIRIFSRYGPLKEAETEVLKKTNRAKVVFKRRADAEVAFSSAGKYSIFGPALISYQLRYMSSTPKTSPHVSPDGKQDTATMDGGNLEVPVQSETKE